MCKWTATARGTDIRMYKADLRWLARALAVLAACVAPGRVWAECPAKTDIQDKKKKEPKPIEDCSQAGLQAPEGPSQAAGDPINVHSGNVFFHEADAVLTGFGSRMFIFSRTYNSDHAYDGRLGAFGRGWSHSFEQVLW